MIPGRVEVHLCGYLMVPEGFVESNAVVHVHYGIVARNTQVYSEIIY
jgi:hypothetical protein